MPSHKITEHKQRLDGSSVTFPCVLLERNTDDLAVLYRLPNEVNLHGWILPKDSYSFGYFWRDRPYNIYQFLAPRNADTLLWYCNISDSTRWDDCSLVWRDLEVDVLVLPDGSHRIVDQDKLPKNLDSELRCYINRATDKLLAEKRKLIEFTSANSQKYLQNLERQPQQYS